jgi:mitochondrial import receptor subunit TOM70
MRRTFIRLLTLGLDFTATTILGKFQNDAAGRSVERVLEKLSKKKAAEILSVSSSTYEAEGDRDSNVFHKNRERRLPSHTFVSAYFSAFRPRMSLFPVAFPVAF